MQAANINLEIPSFDTMNTQDYIELEQQYGAENYHPLDVVITKGEGVWVWDIECKKYLDFLSAYSALNQGHCHPKILQAMIKQAQQVTLTSRAFRNDQLGRFYQKLSEISGLPKVLPMNSGAEAVETAIAILNDKREFNKPQMLIKQGFSSTYFLTIGVGLLYQSSEKMGLQS